MKTEAEVVAVLDRLAKEGFCLWVGAGVTAHLTRGSAPLWSHVVEQIEIAANSESSIPEGATLPRRLAVAARKLGRKRFQAELRERILRPSAQGLIAAMESSPDHIPAEAVQLARLGSCANPIVNFNVETFTSYLLAAPTHDHDMVKVKLLVPEDSFDFFVVRTKRRGPIRAWACVAVCDGGVVYEFDCMTIDEGMTLLGLGRLLERSIAETIEGRFV